MQNHSQICKVVSKWRGADGGDVWNSQQRASSDNHGFRIEAPVVNLFRGRPIFSSAKATHGEQRIRRLKDGRDEECEAVLVMLKIEEA